MFQENAPSPDEIIEKLKAEETWDEQDNEDPATYVEVRGPFTVDAP